MNACEHLECNGACQHVPGDVWTKAIDNARVAVLVQAARRREMVEDIVETIAAGILVLQARDGMSIHRDQALDRARNIAQVLTMKYSIKEI